MLSHYLKDPVTLEQYRRGPAGPYLDEFSGWLEARGYRYSCIRRYLRGANRLSLWAQSTGVLLSDLNKRALGIFDTYLHTHHGLKYPGGYRTHLLRGAGHVIRFLETTHHLALSAPLSPTSSDPELLVAFRRWMRMHRGTTETTLHNCRQTIIGLLASLGEQPERFTAKALRTFILDYTSCGGMGRAKATVTAVRMFLRFLIAVGRCAPELDQAIPPIAQWRRASLPKYLSAENVERVLGSCDLSTPVGVRDRAVLLLLSRLGFRAGDVAGLTFTAIDWAAGTVQVAGKNRRAQRLPLCQEVGDALLAYLAQRPRGHGEQIFLTSLAPIKALSSQAVSAITRRALHRAGVEASSQGAHVLRHSAATEMLRQGLSLPAIGTVLRHVSVETTAAYAKVDFPLLQQVARPWPEEVRC